MDRKGGDYAGLKVVIFVDLALVDASLETFVLRMRSSQMWVERPLPSMSG